MKNKSTSTAAGRYAFALAEQPASTRISTPLVNRLLRSAGDAEELLKRGTKLSGRSDEEILAILNKTPISSD